MHSTNRQRGKRICFLLLLLLLFLGTAINILLIWCRGYGGNRVNRENHSVFNGKVSGVELLVDPNAEDSRTYGNDSILEQGVVIAGQTSLTVPADKKEAAVDFYNPDENAQLYYLTFELRLYDREGKEYEILYTSGLVEPGKHISRITLSHELERGVHEAVIHVQPYRMNEEKTPTNNADIKISLIVQ